MQKGVTDSLPQNILNEYYSLTKMEAPKDLKDLTEKVVQEKPTNVDDALKVSKAIAHLIPDLEKKMTQIQTARGAVLELSTHLEKAFDEIILKTNKPKETHSRFRTKAKFMQKLMEVFDPEKKILDQNFIDNLEKVVILRNLFAHVPVNFFADVLEFDTSEAYIHFFNNELKLKDVRYSVLLFKEKAENILIKIPEFIKIVLDIAENQKKFMDEINQILNDISEEDTNQK